MDLSQFKASLKSGASLAGVYLFAGEEDYLIRYYLSSLKEALNIDPAFAVFNYQSFDGEDIDFGKMTEAIKSPPMMGDYKLVEWRHADFTSLRDRELEQLEELISLAKEHSYAVVAFSATDGGVDFGMPKKPSSFIKRFEKEMNILRFEKSTENQLYAWLKKHFDSHGVEVDLRTVEALVFRSGHSMDVLANEVEKLSALAKARGKSRVTPEDVIEVASSTPECDTFALSTAITDRNKEKAYTALLDMKIKRVDPTVVMGMITKTYGELFAVSMLLEEGRGGEDLALFLKMNPYKAKIYAAAARRYSREHLRSIVTSLAAADASSKFGGISGYAAVELFLSQNL